jgi:hypothetical protein
LVVIVAFNAWYWLPIRGQSHAGLPEEATAAGGRSVLDNDAAG